METKSQKINWRGSGVIWPEAPLRKVMMGERRGGDTQRTCHMRRAMKMSRSGNRSGENLISNLGDTSRFSAKGGRWAQMDLVEKGNRSRENSISNPSDASKSSAKGGGWA